MPYYQGDYYRGDYYRGDPGILSTIAKTALGFVPGGGLIKAGLEFGQAMGGVARKKGFDISRAMKGIPQIQRPPLSPGFRVERIQTAVPPGRSSFMRRRRRMNPGNAKALRRAIRREQAFVTLARRVLKGTGITVSRRSFRAKSKRR